MFSNMKYSTRKNAFVGGKKETVTRFIVFVRVRYVQ